LYIGKGCFYQCWLVMIFLTWAMGSLWGHVSIIYQLDIKVLKKLINNLLTYCYWIYNLFIWLFIQVGYQKNEYPLPCGVSFFERYNKHSIFWNALTCVFGLLSQYPLGSWKNKKINQRRHLSSVKLAQLGFYSTLRATLNEGPRSND
jgi:hypothetical protein